MPFVVASFEMTLLAAPTYPTGMPRRSAVPIPVYFRRSLRTMSRGTEIRFKSSSLKFLINPSSKPGFSGPLTNSDRLIGLLRPIWPVAGRSQSSRHSMCSLVHHVLIRVTNARNREKCHLCARPCSLRILENPQRPAWSWSVASRLSLICESISSEEANALRSASSCSRVAGGILANSVGGRSSSALAVVYCESDSAEGI